MAIATGIPQQSTPAAHESLGGVIGGSLWIGDLTSIEAAAAAQTPSWSYIIGPSRTESEFTRVQVGFAIRKPASSPQNYDFFMLQLMAFAQTGNTRRIP